MAQARLFGTRLSPFVEKVVRALQMKKIGFVLVPPRSPIDFNRWNPQTGKMPVLELTGKRTYDSSLILRSLDENFPEPPLFDRDPATAARQRLLEDWSDESLYWYGMALRWSDANWACSTQQILATLPAWSRPIARFLVPRRLKSQVWGQGLVRLPLAVLLEELGRRFEELTVLLGERRFFFADRPSGADLAIFGQLCMQRSGPTPQVDELLAGRPALVEYAARVDAATAA